MSAAHGQPPGPPAHPLLGQLREFRRDPLRFVTGVAERYGDVVALRAGRSPVLLVRHPDDVQRVLQTHQHLYEKRRLFPLDRLGAVLGRGLVTSAGPLWKRQRTLIQPAFQRDRIAELGAAMERVVTDLVTRWRGPAASGETVDVHREMLALTFRVVGEALFSTDLGPVTDAVRSALATIQHQTNARLGSLTALPLWVPTARNRALRSAVRALDHVVYDVIAARRRATAGSPDLLGLLLAQPADLRDRQLRDEIVTLLLAGHENSGNALTWMWYLLGRHPDAERHLHDEIDRELGERRPGVADLARLPIARMIVAETLRLYPPSWLLLRRATSDDTLRGYRIRSGTLVLISPFLTHRHSDFWPDPETFDYRRFTPEQQAARHRFAYLPFGAGARKCIGADFALTEAQLVLAAVARHYRLRPLDAASVVAPDAVVSLPPRHGLSMTLARRGASPQHPATQVEPRGREAEAVDHVQHASVRQE